MPDLPKNSIIVMDNATFHKNQKTKTLIQSNVKLNISLLILLILTPLNINALKLNLFLEN